MIHTVKDFWHFDSEAKQYQNIVWSLEQKKSLLQSHAEVSGSCLKKPQTLQSFQQSLFIREAREGCG